MDIIPQLIVNSIITGSIYALASVGLALSYGILGILNFAHGHLMMVGAYLFYDFYVLRGLPLPNAILATAGATLLVAAAAYVLFVYPFRNHNSILTFVTTLALATVCESVVSMVYGVNVRSLSAGADIQSLEFFSAYITPLQIGIVISAILILVILAYFVHGTGFGRSLRAMSQHPEAAEALGLNTIRINASVFLLGALLATYAGIMIGFETNLQPTMGSPYTLKALAAMILGGLGNLWGTVVGAFCLGALENFGIGIEIGGVGLPAGYKDAFTFVIILLVLLFRPRGIFGSAIRRF